MDIFHHNGPRTSVCNNNFMTPNITEFIKTKQNQWFQWNSRSGAVSLGGSVFYLKFFLAPVLRTSGSWNLPVRMEGSLVRNFNNYYVLLIHVFDGCSNRLDPCDHFNLVCFCLSPVLISDKRSCWKISQSLKPICFDVEMLVPLKKKKSISAAEMPVKFQSNWNTRKGLAENCDRTSYVILNQPQDLFSVQQTQVW